ncbi:hypothetical protein UGMREWDR_CDS0117 [Aeromonas phage GomatiRiver_11]|nr:hypothetical protein UGMREWDR_CDS0117 [Aeromonas phage GomatiRiver_11]
MSNIFNQVPWLLRSNSFYPLILYKLLYIKG